jgi:hypothetical protein
MFYLPQHYYIRFRYNTSVPIKSNQNKFNNYAFLNTVTSTKINEYFRLSDNNPYISMVYVLEKYDDISISFGKGHIGLYLNSGNINFKSLIHRLNFKDDFSPIVIDKNYYESLKIKRKGKSLGERFLEKCFNEIINLAINNNIEIIFSENNYILDTGLDKLPNFTTLKEKKSFEETLYKGCKELINQAITENESSSEIN